MLLVLLFIGKQFIVFALSDASWNYFFSFIASAINIYSKFSFVLSDANRLKSSTDCVHYGIWPYDMEFDPEAVASFTYNPYIGDHFDVFEISNAA